MITAATAATRRITPAMAAHLGGDALLEMRAVVTRGLIREDRITRLDVLHANAKVLDAAIAAVTA